MAQGEEARVQPPLSSRSPGSPPPHPLPTKCACRGAPMSWTTQKGCGQAGQGEGDSSLWEVEPFLERVLSQTGPRGSGPSSALRPQLLAQVGIRGALILYLLDAWMKACPTNVEWFLDVSYPRLWGRFSVEEEGSRWWSPQELALISSPIWGCEPSPCSGWCAGERTGFAAGWTGACILALLFPGGTWPSDLTLVSVREIKQIVWLRLQRQSRAVPLTLFWTSLDTAQAGSDWEWLPAVSARLAGPQIRCRRNLESVETLEGAWPTKPQA